MKHHRAASVTGNYTFWIASDNDSELRQWTSHASQKSRVILKKVAERLGQ